MLPNKYFLSEYKNEKSFVNPKFCTANLSDHLGSNFHLREAKSFVHEAPGLYCWWTANINV